MSNNKEDRAPPKVQWTAEDRARHQAIREMFRNWHPSPEELIASGEGANFNLQGEYRQLRPFVEEMKRAREDAGLTLADVSRRCGMAVQFTETMLHTSARKVQPGAEL